MSEDLPSPEPFPPLPLVPIEPDMQEMFDGAAFCLIFDNSTIELLRCPRLLEYKWLRKRDLVAAKAGRNFGSTLHCGWAIRYLLCGPNAVTPEVVDKINSAMSVHLSDKPQPLDDFRTYEHAVRVMAAYNEHYKNEPFHLLNDDKGARIVERAFCFPLDFKVCLEDEDVPILYAGKIDLGIRNNDGSWIQDHKTAFMFGDSFDNQMLMDGGQLGYCWAMEQATGQLPKGYIIDAVRIRRPKRSDDYTDQAPVDASDFKRLPFFVTRTSIDEWRRDTIDLIGGIVHHWGRNYFPRHRWQCVGKYGKCDMFDVCSVTEESRMSALNSNLYEDYDWSPLNRPTSVE